MTSPLRQLSALISSSVDVIEREFASQGLSYPSLDDFFDPTSHAEVFARVPVVAEAARLIVAAGGQLSALVHPPGLYVIERGITSFDAAALNVVVVKGIVELLREAGPKGLHVDHIAAKTRMDSAKLARVLRLLASNHIFRETSPDVFANNRLSSALDTGKSHTAHQASPMLRHEGASGLAALVEVQTGEGLKSSGWISDFMTSSSTATSHDIVNIPFNKGVGTELTIWQWWETPGNEYLKARFNKAMEAYTSQEQPEAILNGFVWGGLEPGSKVVDVAGGLGTVASVVATAHSGLRFVVEDRPSVIEHSKKFWKAHLPKANVEFEVFDLFGEQPVKDADVYILRNILHDWPEWHSVQMLRSLRNAAQPATKLVIMEHVVVYACEDTTEARAIPGAEGMVAGAPEPLLPNFGVAAHFSYLSDLLMMALLNGEERTLASFAQLLRKAGWKICEVHSVPGSVFKQIVAQPV
ncbi:S-adenosyl-L-methionine-dependent methyltransferase [Exidia glandulosa HHB12029]|uniref:S-adenosyl-L-methionine-dependent methyltransferase n=1 Tax=Exidia glandulosa HHB12029 TaxID=1314781 RepID=A0A165GK56_EXIGL|nr:S-adenosyl-L-methionine-dependent methyltransferase [Exidia glandulosa HHB12029]